MSERGLGGQNRASRPRYLEGDPLHAPATAGAVAAAAEAVVAGVAAVRVNLEDWRAMTNPALDP